MFLIQYTETQQLKLCKTPREAEVALMGYGIGEYKIFLISDEVTLNEGSNFHIEKTLSQVLKDKERSAALSVPAPTEEKRVGDGEVCDGRR